MTPGVLEVITWASALRFVAVVASVTIILGIKVYR
jgi:hypothetical protein